MTGRQSLTELGWDETANSRRSSGPPLGDAPENEIGVSAGNRPLKATGSLSPLFHGFLSHWERVEGRALWDRSTCTQLVNGSKLPA